MEWLGDILGGVASAASGGLFGLIGSLGGTILKIWQKKQDRAWEMKKWDHEAKMFELQMKASVQETENELAVVSSQGAWGGLESSYRSDASVGTTHVWVNDVKSLFRPFLTLTLVGVAVWIFNELLFAFSERAGLLAQVFTAAEIQEILKYVIYSLIFATSTSIVWWWGDRSFPPPGYKNR